MMILVQLAHCRHRLWNDIVHEEEEGIFWAQVNSFTDEKVELAHGEIGRHEIFLLVQISKTRLGCLLDDHWNSVGILATDLLALGTTLLVWILFFVDPLHAAR